MIAELKPYPGMKDSGVPWLGDVPEHWAIERLKSLVTNVIEQTAVRQSTDLYVALEHVESWTGRLRPAASDVSFDSQVKRFRSGDVLFGKLRPYLAKVTRPRSNGVCVGEFIVLRPRDSRATAPYLEQLLRAKPTIETISASTFGAKMPRADWRFLGGMVVTLPPLPEQDAIIRFLDHADLRIRRYIRAKQKLIKLLEEQKQAIIHRAVTRGLDPAVRLKSSGVEWLGDVPEHWEVRKLGLVARVFNGTTPSRMQPSYWNSGTIPWLASGKVNDYLVQTPTELVTERAVRDCSLSLVPKDSVIIGLVGQGKTRGKSALLAIEACINQNLAAIVPGRSLDGRFLLHLLTAHYGAIREIGRGGNQEALNCHLVASLRLPVPPLDEQLTIVKRIAESTADLDMARASAERARNLLPEYRNRLIADVVTGKLDVREAAARLPDEAAEAEPLGKTDDLTEPEDDAVDDLDAIPEEAEA